METQPKLRDSKKEPEAATGGKVRVPMPRTAPAVPLLQDPEKACWKGCNRSWVKNKKKKKNVRGQQIQPSPCSWRTAVPKERSKIRSPKTPKRYLRLLKPAGLTAISSAGGEELWNWAVSSRCFRSVSHCCSPLHFIPRRQRQAQNVLTVRLVVQTLYTAIQSRSLCEDDVWTPCNWITLLKDEVTVRRKNNSTSIVP